MASSDITGDAKSALLFSLSHSISVFWESASEKVMIPTATFNAPFVSRACVAGMLWVKLTTFPAWWYGRVCFYFLGFLVEGYVS